MVRAGDTAYVVGWRANGAGALWHVDAAGALSRRTAPPGTPPKSSQASADGVLQLAFDDADTGAAITGTLPEANRSGHESLFVTDDGARTWTKVMLPTREQPAKIATGGGATYVLATDCIRRTSPCRHATVWAIDPTGARPPHATAGLPGKLDTSGPIGFAAFKKAVWVALEIGTAGRAPGSFHSSDGGRTWHRFDPGICIWTGLLATSPSVLWTTCGTGMMQHFTRAAGSDAPVQVFTATSGTTGSVLMPLADRVAYAVIDDRHGTRVEVTRDGGRTENTVAAIPRPIERRGFLTTFVSMRVGYLVTQNGGELYRTDDGAQTWHEVSGR